MSALKLLPNEGVLHRSVSHVTNYNKGPDFTKLVKRCDVWRTRCVQTQCTLNRISSGRDLCHGVRCQPRDQDLYNDILHRILTVPWHPEEVPRLVTLLPWQGKSCPAQLRLILYSGRTATAPSVLLRALSPISEPLPLLVSHT